MALYEVLSVNALPLVTATSSLQVLSVNALSLVTATSFLHLQPFDKVVDLMHINCYAIA